MIAHNLLAIVLFLCVLALCAVPLGKFSAKVLSAQSG
jgi:K+-transporting ATPase A subunit